MSDEVLIEELRGAMRSEVDGLEVPPGVIARALESPPRARLQLGWLMPALAVAVAAVVAAVAVTSLSHRSSPAHGPSSAVPVAARGLVSRLAVLRRPQTPADVLPRWAVRETQSLTHGRVIPGLSRLIGAVSLYPDGRSRVYIVVQRPPRFPLHVNHPEPPFLNPRLGDQATIAFVGPFREEAAVNGSTVAAGGETVAATRHGLTADPSQFSSLWGEIAAVVPDGVARVKWVLGLEVRGDKRITVWPWVRRNVALARVSPNLRVYMRSAVWYGRDGRVISSFGLPTSQSVAAARFKRALEASVHQPIDGALLRHFGVLRTKPGAPGLDQVSAAALIEPNPLGLNTSRERFVAYAPTPLKVFVVPGTQGIAVRWVSPASGQMEAGAEAALSGSTFTELRINGRKTVIGLAPDGNRNVAVRLRDGRALAVPVIHNVYAFRLPGGARSIRLRNASGRIVRLRLK